MCWRNIKKKTIDWLLSVHCTGMQGVQFFDRLTLFLMPVKYHPQVSYVKRVKTWRMVMFTLFQVQEWNIEIYLIFFGLSSKVLILKKRGVKSYQQGWGMKQGFYVEKFSLVWKIQLDQVNNKM